MRESIMLKFRQLLVEPTGLYETTGFHDVDIAFGNFITNIVDRARLCEPNDINKAFAQYTDRKPEEKVIVGKFDDVASLLRHIHTAQAGRVTQQHDPHRNSDQLPIVNISRTFQVSIGNTDRAIQTRNHEHREIYDGKGQRPENIVAICASQPATLTYDLFVIGADKESTSLLSNALGMQLVELVNTGFVAKTRLATASFKLDCALDGVKGFMYSDASSSGEQDRYYVASTQISVVTEVITAYNSRAINSVVRVFDPQTTEDLHE